MGATENSNIITTLHLFFIFLSRCSVSSQGKSLGQKQQRKPCNTLTFILYNGSNAGNATSVIVAAPEGGNLTKLAAQFHFGNIVVFDNPLTKNNDTTAEQVGRAQGFCLQLMGTDPILMKSRNLSVVGGTGDFVMTKGIATIATLRIDSVEWGLSFRLLIDIKLYECW
ncbi:dirigent protein-like [Malania oleifera]|uniref:dirigent protein-like n=1 Tax=Malania oleifera TaxID=397392 RepID=UPI0025AE31B2|nr:dirigent protein-like [Malania oleifera]